MSRPVPEAHDTVHDAINRIIPARFADRHAEIVRRSGADDQTWKRDSVATVDPTRDPLIENGRQPSRQLQDLVQEVFEDARRLLRQWLRDGKIQAFCSDPLFGGDIKIAPSAWGLQTTDRAIAGGDYHPYGPTKPGGTVGLLRSDVERVVSGATSENPNQPPPLGPSSSAKTSAVYSREMIERAIQITAELLKLHGESLHRPSALAAVKATFPAFSDDKFRSTVWPLARQRSGMPLKGKPGPK